MHCDYHTTLYIVVHREILGYLYLGSTHYLLIYTSDQVIVEYTL